MIKSQHKGDPLTLGANFVISLFLVLVLVLGSILMLEVGPASGEVLLPNHQSADPWTNLLPLSGRSSLLDPSRLNISHELVFSYSSDPVFKGNTGGMFLTRFQYPLASPLMLDLTIGSALSHSQVRGFQSNDLFIRNFTLQYAPSDKFFLIFNYEGGPYNRLSFPAH